MLKELADRKHVSVAQLAIAWLLHQSRVTSVIVGAKRIEQLSDNLGAVDVALSGEELRSLDQVSQLPAEYPRWMLTSWKTPEPEHRGAVNGRVGVHRRRAGTA